MNYSVDIKTRCTIAPVKNRDLPSFDTLRKAKECINEMLREELRRRTEKLVVCQEALSRHRDDPPRVTGDLPDGTAEADVAYRVVGTRTIKKISTKQITSIGTQCFVLRSDSGNSIISKHTVFHTVEEANRYIRETLLKSLKKAVTAHDKTVQRCETLLDKGYRLKAFHTKTVNDTTGLPTRAYLGLENHADT